MPRTTPSLNRRSFAYPPIPAASAKAAIGNVWGLVSRIGGHPAGSGRANRWLANSAAVRV
jgi:hypothetical protein